MLQEAGGRPRRRREGRLITGPDRWTATDWPAGRVAGILGTWSGLVNDDRDVKGPLLCKVHPDRIKSLSSPSSACSVGNSSLCDVTKGNSCHYGLCRLFLGSFFKNQNYRYSFVTSQIQRKVVSIKVGMCPDVSNDVLASCWLTAS